MIKGAFDLMINRKRYPLYKTAAAKQTVQPLISAPFDRPGNPRGILLIAKQIQKQERYFRVPVRIPFQQLFPMHGIARPILSIHKFHGLLPRFIHTPAVETGLRGMTRELSGNAAGRSLLREQAPDVPGHFAQRLGFQFDRLAEKILRRAFHAGCRRIKTGIAEYKEHGKTCETVPRINPGITRVFCNPLPVMDTGFAESRKHDMLVEIPVSAGQAGGIPETDGILIIDIRILVMKELVEENAGITRYYRGQPVCLYRIENLIEQCQRENQLFFRYFIQYKMPFAL